MADSSTIKRLTGESVELLQALIRNQCVNDGSPESGYEDRSARLLLGELDGLGLDIELYEPTPGRTSLVTRYPGTDPDAPAICLMGHTDVVPVNPDGWRHDPFGGHLIDGEIWGRGAVDMLNLTATMAVAFRHVVSSQRRYPGDIIYFAVADEEGGGVHGASPLVERHWDHLECDYVLTEFGGVPLHSPKGTSLLVTTAEKGMGSRRITVGGTPGHGSRPHGADNALIKAAEVIRRIGEYTPAPILDELWVARVRAMGLDEDLTQRLLDPAALDEAIEELPPALAAEVHSCSHMSFSPNVIHGGVKTNVIPDSVTIEVDIRTLPGETEEDVDRHIRHALGDMMAHVQVEPIFHGVGGASSRSPAHGPLWEALGKGLARAYPDALPVPSMVTGGTDSRFFRQKGAVAYGAGLLSPEIDAGEFRLRFHGHNERIDVESLRLTTALWLDILDVLWD